MTRRDARALEERIRLGRSDRFLHPHSMGRTSPAERGRRPEAIPGTLRKRWAAGAAMSMIALFTIGASLPVLAVPTLQTASPVSGEVAGELAGELAAAAPQSLSTTTTAPIPFVRDGFIAADIPVPASYTQVASNGLWASLDPSQLSEQGWALPVLGRISSPYGPRPYRPVAGVGAYHHGIDIAASCGQPVFAASGGTVVESGYHGSYGNWVLIDHGDALQTGYAHGSTLLVDQGETVAAGDIIGFVGTTGSSTGCHVHFEARVSGNQVDPGRFMQTRGVTLD